MPDYEPLRGDSAGVREAGGFVRWDETRDVVVVGLGAAGGGAGFEAARCGADTLVVDRFRGGGATGRSAGVIYFGGGTRLQRDFGYDDSPQNMFDYLALETDGCVSDETLRAFCETSVENFDLLCRFGVPFPRSGEVVKVSYPPSDCTLYFSGNELCPPYSERATPAPRGHRPLGRGLTGHLIAAGLRRGTLDAGAEIRSYTRAERLIVDDDGEVIGLVLVQLPSRGWVGRANDALQEMIHYGGALSPRAQRLMQASLHGLERRGQRRYVRVRGGVVLASGGFVFNRELMAERAPAYAGCSLALGTAGDDGAGIQMGAAVGGAMGRMDKCSAPRFVDPPRAWLRGILVNRDGQRICNETFYGGKVGEQMIEGHRGRGTMILDAAMMSEGRRSLHTSHAQAFQWIFAIINGFITSRSAPTLRELAKKVGIDSDGLEQTVSAYNDGARRGVDAKGKSPDNLGVIERGPFYAIPLDYDSLLFPTPCITLGGLRTDGLTARVQREDGSVIEGLYAAGRTAVGVSSNGYASGLSVSDGMFTGRNAASHAARRAANSRHTITLGTQSRPQSAKELP